MGKTPQPLVIGVYGLDPTNSVLQRLSEQGHILMSIDDSLDSAPFDLVIGPKCWRTLPDLKYLDVTLKVARKAKYGKRLVMPQAP